MTFQDIIDFVIGIISDAISFLVSLVNGVIQILDAVFTSIWNVIVNVVGTIVSVFQKLGTFFVHLWSDYIKPAIHGLIDLYHEISARLHQIFDPLIRIIQRVRTWFYRYIYPWIRLAQQILSAIRAVLALFRILGARWAAKLDADIQRIQGYLTTALTDIVGTLNSVSTWLNFALDPFGLIRKDFFSASAFGNLGTIRHALTFGNNRYLTASEAANTDGDRNMIAGGAAVLTRNADGSVTYSDASKRINAGYDTAWKEYGGTTAVH